MHIYNQLSNRLFYNGLQLYLLKQAAFIITSIIWICIKKFENNILQNDK
jgi:hypothetical protein